MKRTVTLGLFITTIAAFCAFCAEPKDVVTLREGFRNPTRSARPHAYWDWVDGNVDLEEITRELEGAARMGMGGFDIWDVRKVVDEDNIVPAGPAFMSEESVEAICHAITEAKRLNLDMGIVTASGWNAGGAWTKPEHQTMGLFRCEIVVGGPGKIAQAIPFPELPDMIGTPGLESGAIIKRGPDGLPVFYTEVAVLAIPATDKSTPIDRSLIYDISDKLDSSGTLTWQAPPGKWKITRYVCANTGQAMISHTPNSRGPMIDHFSAAATEEHINFFITKLEAKLGKPIGQSGLSYLYTNSYEVVGQLWTPAMTEEFETRFGYSLIPYLPVLDGHIVENEDITSRFLYDYRKVLSDLIIDNHYVKARQICERHGIQFVAEAAGPGQPVHNCPFESLKSSGALSFPRGEFWHIPPKGEFWKRHYDAERRHHYLQQLQVIKGVASASHIYDQTYVEAEAFTGTHLWHEGPADLKPTADRAFCEGLNRIVFHTWPHTPPEAGRPGWIYAFGTIHNETRIWWPLAKPWIGYLGRCSFVLQQGNFCADVLYYYGDQAPNFVGPKHVDSSLGFGYDYDVTNTDILVNRLSVKDGKLTLPHGPQYEILVLPDDDQMQPEVLNKIEQLVKAGATVIGPKPTRSPGLKDFQKKDTQVKEPADKLWGPCDGKTVLENKYGKGRIIWGRKLKDILADRGVTPDFDFTGSAPNAGLDFIHRKTANAEIYFLRNKTNVAIHGTGRFRVHDSQPEFWNPVTANTVTCAVFTYEKNGTIVPISLAPLQSLFMVFCKTPQTNHIVRIEKDSLQIFPAEETWSEAPLVFQPTTISNQQLVFTEVGEYKLTASDGTTEDVTINDSASRHESTGAWSVCFPEDMKGPGDVTFDELIWWNKSDQDGIKYFSGMAVYEKEIDIPERIAGGDYRVTLDLGELEKVARVHLNGQNVGIVWTVPATIDITDAVKAGPNKLKVEVANTWANRLVGDAKVPPAERITKTNVTRLPNPWSYPMKDIPNERLDLMNSGLKGPVSITAAKMKKLR